MRVASILFICFITLICTQSTAETHLDKLIGDWKKDDVSCQGKWLVGKRFVLFEYNDTKSEISGAAVIGYDDHKKKYIASWVGNKGSGIQLFDGNYDSSSTTFTFSQEKFKYVLQVQDNHLAFQAHNDDKKTIDIQLANQNAKTSADLTNFIDKAIKMLKDKEYKAFIERAINPQEKEELTKVAGSIDKLIETFKNQNAELLLRILKALKDKKPELNEKGNLATYTIPEGPGKINFAKVDGKWYINNR